MNKIETVGVALRAVSEFCNEHLEICSAHTVDFIVQDRWNILPEKIRGELSKMTIEQLEELPKQEFLNDREYPFVSSFIRAARKHTIEAMSKLLPQPPEHLFQAMNSTCVPTNHLMPTKKCHEVKAMSTLVSSLASKHNANTVIDFGTGKGYLAADLALNHSLNVLGIDSSEGNCKAATERNAKLLTKFNKAKLKPKQFSEGHESMPKNRNSSGIFVGRTLTIGKDTDFRTLIEDFVKDRNIAVNTNHYDDSVNSHILLSGLHVCGNLSPCLVKHFVSMKEAKILCAVGCCYQHVQEKFCLDAFGARGQCDYGFPLSEQLLKNRYNIGRNGRMLASQGLARIAKNGSIQHKFLFYRAVFQVILKDYGAESMDVRVGKLASKCSSFKDYARKALKRLQMEHIKISDEELDGYLDRCRGQEQKLCAFHIMRLFLAPCIEALILLDRLAYLLQQKDVKESYLLRLFDPIVSPRCYAIVAVKH